METLLGTLAEAIVALLLENLERRPGLAMRYAKVHDDIFSVKQAVQSALGQSCQAVVERYPLSGQTILREHLLPQARVAGELVKLWLFDQTPDLPSVTADIPELQFFLQTLVLKIKSQTVFKFFPADLGAASQEPVTTQSEPQREESPPTQVQIQSAGGAVVGGDVAAEQDVVMRDKITNIYNIITSTPVDGIAEPAVVQTLAAQRLNPFTNRGRINDPQFFFGRHQLLRELKQSLANGNSSALIGPPEVGKSSVLFYLYLTRLTWLPTCPVIYLDLQKVFDEKDFCYEIGQVLTQPQQREPRTITEALRGLKRAFSGNKTLLMLDEVERLAHHDFTPNLQGLLRALVQDGKLTLLLASDQPLPQIFPPSEPTSPLHNVVNAVEIFNFTAAETYQFLRHRLATTGIVFDEQELQQIWSITQGHPGQVQRAAEKLFNRKVGVH